jgi:hypothetical protein
MSDEKEWNDIINMYAFDVYAIDELDSLSDLQIALYSQLVLIFNQLKKLKRGRFFKQREFDVIWLMMRTDILMLNDLAKEGRVLKDVYEILLNLFNDLIKVAERKSDYECASNLLKFRDIWFDTFNIKIKKVSGSQQK